MLGTPWKIKKGALYSEWKLGNFNEVAALVSFVVRTSKSLNHHPTMEFGYQVCRLTYITHSAGGLTELDFTCAARISALITRRQWAIN